MEIFSDIGPDAHEAVPYIIPYLSWGWNKEVENKSELALKKIIGKDFGTDEKKWKQWWEAQH